MINDLGELKSPQEQRSPGGYVHILQEEDQVETSSQGGMEFVELPRKNIGSMGNTWIYLQKPIASMVIGGTGLYLSDKGVKKISDKEAFEQRLCILNIRIENPISRLRAGQYFVHLSIDGQTDAVESEMRDETEGVVKYRSHEDTSSLEKTFLFAITWKSNQEKSDETRFYYLYVPYSAGDRNFIESLWLRVSELKPEPGGGN